jgi:hypothetical protein
MRKLTLMALGMTAAVCTAPASAAPPVGYVSAATPTQEVTNPTIVSGDPSCVTTFKRVEDRVSFRMRCFEITGITMAHIHGPATADANGGIMVTLLPTQAPSGLINGFVVQGTFSPGSGNINTGVTFADVIAAMNNDLAYVNVHTEANGGGEVRGQIAAVPEIPKVFALEF